MENHFSRLTLVMDINLPISVPERSLANVVRALADALPGVTLKAARVEHISPDRETVDLLRLA